MAKQQFKNRRDIQAAVDREFDLRSWLRSAFSSAFNLFTERTCAKPDYAEYKRTGISAADAAPSTTPPGASTWNLDGYWGLHGYVKFTAGTNPTVDLELWAFDPINQNWFFVDAFGAVSGLVEFHFDGRVRNRTVFVRVANITGSPTSFDIICSPE